MTADALLAEWFGDRSPYLRVELAAWLRDSRRFKAFAIDHRVKIAAKLRQCRDDDGLADLCAELEAAKMLLHDSAITLEYEQYVAGKQRGPDFTATFKTHTRFNVEVRRMRASGDATDDARQPKLMTVLCDKIGQMPPSIINLLWLATDGNDVDGLSVDALSGAMAVLRGLASRKDEAYFARRGFASAAEFVNRERRLSGVVIRATGGCAVWVNTNARHAIPPELLRALARM